VSAEPLFVTVENDLVLARSFDAHSVIDKGFARVDYGKGSAEPQANGGRRRTVEDEQQSGSFKDEHLVRLVLERDIGLDTAR
jgi:hypothetical protein